MPTPLDGGYLTTDLGIYVRNNFKSYRYNIISLYAITGINTTARGGSIGDYCGKIGSSYCFNFPIHIGFEFFPIKKLSFFTDIGPNFVIPFKIVELSDRARKTGNFIFGSGINMGMRIKNFAISIGYDIDANSIFTYALGQTYSGQGSGKFDNTYKLRNDEFHIILRWTL